MKVYKLEVFVIDFDHLGGDGIKETIENQKYPNWCIAPSVKKIKERDIGEWSDDNQLNKKDTCDAEYERLFSQGD